MPISHTCPHCGVEIGRTAPVPDPVYGLPLVTCPGCARRTPRGRIRGHLLLVIGRGVHDVTASLVLMAASALMFLVLVAAVAASGEALGRSLDGFEIGPESLLIEGDAPAAAAAAQRLRAWWMTPMGFYGFAYLAAAVVAGAYLRSAMAHCRGLVALAVFVATVGVVSAWHQIWTLPDVPFAKAPLPSWDAWARNGLLPAMSAIPVALGFPIGAALRRLGRGARRSVYLSMLRRTRARRAAA